MKFPIHIIVYCDNPELAGAAYLTLDSVRVGFPTSEITVHWCGNNVDVMKKVVEKADLIDAKVNYNFAGMTHPAVVKQLFLEESHFILLDSDVVFWKNCEDFQPTKGLIAGRLIPQYECPVVEAVMIQRLHTSFMYFLDTSAIRDAIKKENLRYVTFDPISPFISCYQGRRHFYDTTANLYQLIDGEIFDEEMMDRFDHLGCGSYIDKVEQIRPDIFKGVNKDYKAFFNDTLLMKNLWKNHNEYYRALRV